MVVRCELSVVRCCSVVGVRWLMLLAVFCLCGRLLFLVACGSLFVVRCVLCVVCNVSFVV